MSDFKFSQNGKMLETTTDNEFTKNLLNSILILKLNLVTNPHQFNEQFEMDNSKFKVNYQSIRIFVKTLTGKSVMINVNPKITKVGELKLKI